MNKFLVVVLCLIMGFAGFAFFATNNHGQAGIKEDPKLANADSLALFEELTGQPLTKSFLFLKDAKSAQFVDLRNRKDVEIKDRTFDNFKDEATELNKRQISIISVALTLNTDSLLRKEGTSQPVKFCGGFVPTYSLVFEFVDMEVTLVPCFKCNDISIEIKKDGETHSFPYFELRTPGGKLFEDILYVTSNENEEGE